MRTDHLSQVRQRDTIIDAGLRKHFQGVYNIMALGLAVTGATAYTISNIPGIERFYVAMYSNPFLGLLIMFSPMIVLRMLFSGSRIYSASFQSLVMGFVGFSAFMGFLFGTIFLVYDPVSIAKTFFITAATFAGMSIIGYTTKRDLSKMGSLLQMALLGLFLSVVVNVFLQSPVMHMVISGVGILIYTGLTAWDTQNIKEMYRASNGDTVNAKLSVMGALSLYMNFIMLFQFLLRFIGNSRS